MVEFAAHIRAGRELGCLFLIMPSISFTYNKTCDIPQDLFLLQEVWRGQQKISYIFYFGKNNLLYLEQKKCDIPRDLFLLQERKLIMHDCIYHSLCQGQSPIILCLVHLEWTHGQRSYNFSNQVQIYLKNIQSRTIKPM